MAPARWLGHALRRVLRPGRGSDRVTPPRPPVDRRQAPPATAAPMTPPAGPRRSSSSWLRPTVFIAEHPPDLLPREQGPASAVQARQPLRDRESARSEHRPQQLLLLAKPLAPLAQQLDAIRDAVSSRIELGGALSRLRQMRHPVGLQPLEQRVAVPGLDDRGNRVGPRRVLVPEDAEAEERRNDGQAQALGAGPRSPRARSDAVARPALPLRRPLEGHAAGGDAGLPGARATSWASGWRCSSGIRSGAQ